jgi:hypothetical protein
MDDDRTNRRVFDCLIAINGIQGSRMVALVRILTAGPFALFRRALRIVCHVDREYFPASSTPDVRVRRVPL